ncbi:MAG TPA: OpgC domain-containing protein, partial [Bradyrhizobium sp.]|nr:OpgC domain-containing protein [Bradyrhizobium sp.]
GDAQFADETHIGFLLDQPGAALSHLAILQYRPVNTDVLPNFIVYHLLFAPLLWLLLKSPNLMLGASLCLYLTVQIYGWNLPQWPINDWYFNPFSWQVLVILGAWGVLGGGEKLWLLLMSRTASCLAAIFLLFSLVVVREERLSD